MTNPKKRERRKDFSRLDWRRKALRDGPGDTGRITRPSGARNARELADRHAILDRLFDAGQLEVLRQLRDGQLDMRVLVEADRAGMLLKADLASHLKLKQPLWETLETRIVPLMGKSEKTKQSYRERFKSVRDRGILGDDATFADLLTTEWRLHRSAFTSAAAWNHVRRGFSAALSVLLGDKWHPARRAFVAKFGPMDKEVAREVAVTPAQLKRLLAHVPELTRPAVVALLVTGVRVGELCGERRAPRFDPETGQLTVWGKTDQRVVMVQEAFRGIVTAALPVRVAKRTLQQHVKRARDAAKLAGFRTNDLRHAAAGLALDGGAPVNAVQDLLGHTDLATTARYTRTGNARKASDAIERVLDLNDGATNE